MKIMLTLITGKVVECQSIAYVAPLLLGIDMRLSHGHRLLDMRQSHWHRLLEMNLQHEGFP
jgi:hypothetical protein